MSARTALRPARVHSVKDLLAHNLPSLKRITDQAARADFWSGWLAGHLAAELCARISGIAERDGTLVIFAETAAWSVRLRYAVIELERDIRAAGPGLSDIAVRVRPHS
jgi:hypothetical protein